MAQDVYVNGSTLFLVDWDLVKRIEKAYWTSFNLHKYSKEVTLSDSRWYNPFSYSMPDISQIETPWWIVTPTAEGETEIGLGRYKEAAKTNIGWVAQELEKRIKGAHYYKKLFRDMQSQANDKSMTNIARSVDSYTSQIEVAKFIRDTSSEGLMIGATLASGGTALAILTGGSVLKGTAKYQDTGSLAAGAMEMSGNLAFGFLKLNPKYTASIREPFLVVLKASWSMATDYVGGDSFGKAALSGSLQVAGGLGADKVFSSGLVKKGFEKAAIPINITHQGKKITAELTEKWVSEIAQGQVKNGVVNSVFPEEKSAGRSTIQNGPLDSFTFAQKSMLDQAIIPLSHSGEIFGRVQ